ncbi:ATP-binding cassette, subfamily B [Rhizobacter sp. OV335]|nr:ATP-binding cassette, subfamily B [Rhizobacter sp. OV335]
MSPAALLATLWRVLPARRRRTVGLTTGVMLIAAAAELGTLIALKEFLTTVVHAVDQRQLLVPSLVFAGSAIALAGARLATLKLQDGFVLAFAGDASSEIFSRALRQPYLQHVKRESAELFAALEDMQRLVNGALGPLAQALVSAALATVLLAYLLVIAPIVVLPVLGLLALLYGSLSVWATRRTGHGLPTLQALAVRRLHVVHEAQSGFRDLVLSHEQSRATEQFRQAEADYRSRQASDRFAALGPRHVVELVVVLVAVALVWLLSSRTGGLIPGIPVIGVAALGMQRLLPMINGSHAGWRLFKANSDVLAQTLRLMQRPALPMPQVSAAAVPFERSITLEQVEMRYDDRELVLRHVDLTIHKGERVAIVGPSGSGKTSLLDILLGLVAPTAGRLLVDGVPLDSHERLWAWQRQLACVAQNVYLRDASVRDVVMDSAVNSPVNAAQFDSAVRGAGLGPWLASLPSGADTRVGDGGVLLSGGQRQRIAIARALYRQAPVLVLDEATSQLDAATEAGILDTLDALGASMTILIVTHRDAALRGCNRILDVRHGSVVERVPAGAP